MWFNMIIYIFEMGDFCVRNTNYFALSDKSNLSNYLCLLGDIKRLLLHFV